MSESGKNESINQVNNLKINRKKQAGKNETIRQK